MRRRNRNQLRGGLRFAYPPHAIVVPLLLLGMAGCETVKSTFHGAEAEARQANSLLGTGETFAISGLEGRWAGPVTPTAANCGDPTTGLMTIGDDGFGFDPFGSATVITGSVAKDGTLSGTLSRVVSGGGAGSIEAGLPASGGKHQAQPAAPMEPRGARTLSISLNAKAARGTDGRMAIEGVLTSGRCTWSVALRRG